MMIVQLRLWAVALLVVSSVLAHMNLPAHASAPQHRARIAHLHAHHPRIARVRLLTGFVFAALHGASSSSEPAVHKAPAPTALRDRPLLGPRLRAPPCIASIAR